MSEQVIPERPNFRTCKHGNAACLCAECDPVIPKRQTAGHGYDAECECDLVGGDPDCKIQPPYETVEAYIFRLQSKVAELERKIDQLEEHGANQQKVLDLAGTEMDRKAATIESLTDALIDARDLIDPERNQQAIEIITAALNAQDQTPEKSI
jgi:hypothetical protein